MRGHSVEKVMLSIPTSIKIEHNQRKRKIVVSIQNIDNETKCFCVHPHLSLVNVQWLKINTSLDLENQERKIISEIIEKNRHYAPTECWNGTASCNPDSWFEGTGGVMVQGKEFGFKEINITVPQNISQAPTGRWAFRMDVCEYRPRCIRHTLQKKSCSEWAGLCDNCQPSNCRYSVLIDECRSQSDDDCYILYDSQQFDVKLVEGGGVGD